jgi:hypothetical protein
LRITGLIALLALSLLGVLPPAAAREDIEERSPFEMVRFPDEGAPEVKVRGRWYRFVSIDGTSFDVVREGARKVDARDWRRRFSEDLVASLLAVDVRLGDTVTLDVVDLETQGSLELPRVRMSRSNRSRIHDARPWVRPVRLKREHGKTADERFAFLTTRFHDNGDKSRLSAAQAADDLDELEWRIEHAFACRDRLGVDYRAAFDTIRSGLGNGIARADLRLQLQKLLALFGDVHTRVRGWPRDLLEGSLPVVFTSLDEGGTVLALRSDGAFFDAAHPRVDAIDGLPIARWLEAAGRYHPRSTRRAHVMESLERLEDFAHMRAELGLPTSKQATLRLSDGKSGMRDVRMDLVRGAHALRVRRQGPRSGSRHAGFGYVRVRRMDERSATAALEDFERVITAPGLIIDVRGNGGGSRDLLRALIPRVARDDALPLVFNVAAYRMPPGTRPRRGGYLGNRALFTLDSPKLGPSGIAAAKTVLAAFRPSMPIDPRLFSDWHVAMIPARGKGLAGNGPYFTGPITVLIDEGCFSATDIFVGALELLPNVTLIGTTTGGGSGRSETLRLAHSGIEVRVSTMASFRPNGLSYDGNGVAPDIEVKPTLEDLNGKTDTVLEQAVVHLRKATAR